MSETTQRYAAALFGAAGDDAKAVRAAAEALMADKSLWNALQSKAVTLAEKKQLLAGAAELDGQDAPKAFLGLLAEAEAMDSLPAILAEARRLDLTARDPRMTPELQAVIDHDRKELAGDFCRSCGYCLPCTVGIDIPQAARMAQLLRRSPYQPYMSDEWHAKMHKIEDCIHCDACRSRCPYGLDTPALLQKQLADYDAFYAAHHND